MAIKGLTLQLLLALAFYEYPVSGEVDCTLPWFGRIKSKEDESALSFIDETKYVFNNICPTPIIGDQSKTYCCYNIRGEVECCDSQSFIFMGFICLIPVFIILFMMCCCICRVCCPCCFKRRTNGRVIGNLSPANLVFIETLPSTVAQHNSYYAPGSTGSTPLIPNEHLPSKNSYIK